MISIDYGYATHPGLKRQRNEDSYFVEPDLCLWGVADGMGGHASGEVASGIVARELPALVRQGQDLPTAILAVHGQIQRAAEQGIGGADMGSTVVAAKLDGCRYQVAWVGDSRAYLWNGVLRQITRDHSYVQLLLEAGLIEESEMAAHPARNIVCQALGGSEDQQIRVDVVSGELAPGESLLLCSDGLNGDVTDVEIAVILKTVEDNRIRANRLIEAALAAGGNDNVTVVLLMAADSTATSAQDDEITRPPVAR